MAKNDKGNIAREMAATPIRRTEPDAAPAQAQNEPEETINPFALQFTAPDFALPSTVQTATKHSDESTSITVAVVKMSVLPSGLQFSPQTRPRIRRHDYTVTENGKAEAVSAYYLSMPSSRIGAAFVPVLATADDPALAVAYDDWKESVVRAYLAWKTEAEKTGKAGGTVKVNETRGRVIVRPTAS